jgi:LacI family transcriptional regulator
MATLKDVAKLACVDISTVSRALNNVSYVHPETKERILRAVKELSYQPNILAKGLRMGKLHTIGVIVPRIQITIFAEIIEGIQQEVQKNGYETLICHTEDDQTIERECLTKLRSGFVDGMLIAGTGKNYRLIRDIQAEGIPVVQIVRAQDEAISSVCGDYEACGYHAVEFLYKKGCRKIGLINGSMDLAPYRKRYLGYKHALLDLRLTEYSAARAGETNIFDYGYHCTGDLLKQESKLDAILAAVDIQGLGVIRALKERAVKVPDDIKVMSLTGHHIGAMLETTMTALEIPAHEMGQKAVRMLIDSIESPVNEKPAAQHLVFPPQLTERETT